VSRKAIINDDLNGIMTLMSKFGRAYVRKLVKTILAMLKGGVNAYDGAKLFALRTASTRNYIPNVTLANSAAGFAAVQAACALMRGQTDPDNGELLGVVPKYILTGTTLGPIARQLVKSATMLPVSTSGGGTYNEIAYLEVIEDPLIDTQISTTFSAVLADPADFPVIEVGFLDGKAEPDLLVKRPEMVSMAGGAEDIYGYEFDNLNYKSRHDWAAQLAYWQGICRISS